jgi:carboxyl-terminal processing protease
LLALAAFPRQLLARGPVEDKPLLNQPNEVLPPIVPVAPGPVDGRIAFLTAQMLEQFQYLNQTFDSKLSSKFLDHYLEYLDPQHMHFTQEDLAEFEPYRTNLDKLTITSRQFSDTRPACRIFNRFMERFEQRVEYADKLLKTSDFKFDGDDRIQINRHEEPYPKDLEAARALWRERLRFEYLQEKLTRDGAKKKQNASKSDTEKAGAAPKSQAEEIVGLLERRYHRMLRTFIDWNNEDVLQAYLSTLAHLYDPHSDYMGRQQLEAFSINMNLALFGIGAELFSDDGYCTIRRLLPGGPAEKSGKVHANDRIVAVSQGDQPSVDLVEMNLSKAVQLIRGPRGTEVHLTIVPAGADPSDRVMLTLVRDEIKLEDQEAKAKIIDLSDGKGGTNRLGIIDLPSFYATFDVGATKDKPDPKSTTADVSKLLEKLKAEHVEGVIVDLRRNGGGSLDEAINLTGLFIKDGPVVQVKDSRGSIQQGDDRDSSVRYAGPLMVLTSRFSASASEIMAGALQDYGRAVIVGDSSTHGKGTVQQVNQLRPYMRLPENLLTNEPGAVKLTIKKFYRVSGASTQKKGVTPDIVLPAVVNESKEIGESALDNPLEWDTIKTAKYDHLGLVEPYLTELRSRSSQRILNDPEFRYILEDIDIYKKQQADKTISLNEKMRLQEKAEIEARQKQRDKERLARIDPPEQVYEITLKLAAQPGLPKPLEKTNSVIAKVTGPKSNLVNAAGSTNLAAVASAPLKESTSVDPEADDEEKPAPVDATMVETERILLDYLSLLPKHSLVTAGH